MQKIIIASAVCAGIVAPARGQAPDDAGRDAIVVTASRLPLAPREIGSAVSVVTAQDLERGQIIFVKDALQDLAGVQVSTDRPGDLTSVSIRGSDNDQLLWLYDGIELGDPSTISTQFQADHLTSMDIARIEVLRGNQSSLYGSDAIGGVVNIITQRASEDGVHINAEGEGGSHGTVNGGASILGRSGPLDFRITATGYQHDGPSLADPQTADPAGSVTENDAYWRYGFSGRAGLAATEALSFQLIGLWQDSDSDLDNTTSDSSDRVRKREYAIAGQARYQSIDGKFRADASLSQYEARRRYFGSFYAPEGDLNTGIKTGANLNLSYDGGLWSIAAGAAWDREKTEQLTLFSGAFDAKVDTKSGYGELALRPIENLTLTGAARIDDNSRFGTFDTYRGTIAYVVPGVLGSNGLKLRASYGTGAKAPGLYQLFDPSYGNPDLKVEESRGGDVGVDIDYRWFTAQLSYFFTWTKNEIVFDGSIPPFGGYAQFGRTRKHGLEVAFTVRPIEAIAISQSFTALTAETDPLEDGHYIDMGRPKHSGSTAITLMPDKRFSLTGRARYRSTNRASFGGDTPAFAVFDLLGSYRIGERIELYGRLTNLLDQDYQLTYGTNALGRAGYGGIRVKW